MLHVHYWFATIGESYVDLEGDERGVAAGHGLAQRRGGGVDEAHHGYPLVPVQRVADEHQPLVAQLPEQPRRVEPAHERPYQQLSTEQANYCTYSFYDVTGQSNNPLTPNQFF